MMLTYCRLYLNMAFNVVFVAIFFVHISGSDMIMIRDDPLYLKRPTSDKQDHMLRRL